MDFDGLFDVGRVRSASSVDSEDPEVVLLSITQARHHVMKVRALLWSLIGLSPFHCAGFLVLHNVAKDPAFAIVARHLPLQADSVLGLVIGFGGDWRAGPHCECRVSRL